MPSRKLFYLQALTAVLFGALALNIIVLLFSTFPDTHSFFSSTSYGPWLEESLKFAFVVLLVRVAYLHAYAIPFIGIGFGFAEGISHMLAFNQISAKPFFVHIALAMVMAYFFYLARKAKNQDLRGIFYSLALLVPVALHLLYNLAVVNP